MNQLSAKWVNGEPAIQLQDASVFPEDVSVSQIAEEILYKRFTLYADINTDRMRKRLMKMFRRKWAMTMPPAHSSPISDLLILPSEQHINIGSPETPLTSSSRGHGDSFNDGAHRLLNDVEILKQFSRVKANKKDKREEKERKANIRVITQEHVKREKRETEERVAFRNRRKELGEAGKTSQCYCLQGKTADEAGRFVDCCGGSACLVKGRVHLTCASANSPLPTPLPLLWLCKFCVGVKQAAARKARAAPRNGKRIAFTVNAVEVLSCTLPIKGADSKEGSDNGATSEGGSDADNDSDTDSDDSADCEEPEGTDSACEVYRTPAPHHHFTRRSQSHPHTHSQLQSQPQLKKSKKRKGMFDGCKDCRAEPASIRCTQCELEYCTDCDLRAHVSRATKNHTRLPINNFKKACI